MDNVMLSPATRRSQSATLVSGFRAFIILKGGVAAEGAKPPVVITWVVEKNIYPTVSVEVADPERTAKSYLTEAIGVNCQVPTDTILV
jgi:hypothetical protein